MTYIIRFVFALALMGFTSTAILADAHAQDAVSTVSATEIEQFASAVAKIGQVNNNLEQQVADAQTTEEKMAIQNQAAPIYVQIIEAEGLTVDRYNQIASLSQADQELADKIVQELQQ